MFGQKSSFGTGSFGTSSAGGTSLFSQNKPVGVSFGQPQTQTSTTTGLFGQSNPVSSNTSTLFGSPAVSSGTTGSLFGGTSFGQPSGGGLFGSQKPPLFAGTSVAGPTGAGSGLFGTTQQQSSLFGSPGGTTGSSLFGGSTVTGTTVKFEPPIAQDTMMKNNLQTSIQTKHMCITAMKQYELKSLEELRVEDYLGNRKGPTTGFSFGSQQSAAPGSLFSGTATATTSQSLFGGAQKSLFGNTSSATSAGGLFGQAATSQSGGGLFGGGQKSLFGTSTTSSGGGFGFTTPGFTAASSAPGGGLFNTKPVQGGGLFGATGTSQPFGHTQPQTGVFAFGQTQPKTSGLFGSGTGGFGTSTSTGLQFSTPSTGGFGTSTGSLFAPKTTTTNAPSFGGFPTQTTSSFGTGSSLFGSGNQAKPGGLFGQTATSGTGLFGASTSVGTGSGLFGSQTKPTFTPFPTSASNPTAGLATSLGGIGGTSGGSILPQPLTIGTDPAKAAAEQAMMQCQVLGMAASPYRDYPLVKLLGQKKDDPTIPSPTDPLAQSRVLQGSKQHQSATSPPFVSRIATKPLPFPKPSPRLITTFNRSLVSSKGSSGSFQSEPKTMIHEGLQLRRNVKKLIIPQAKKSSAEGQMNSLNNSTGNFLPENDTVTRPPALNATWAASNERRLSGRDGVQRLNLDTSADEEGFSLALDSFDGTRQSQFTEYSNQICAPVARRPSPTTSKLSGIEKTPSFPGSDGSFLATVGETTAFDSNRKEINEADASEDEISHPTGIKLRRSDYYTIPSMEELKGKMNSLGECWIEDGFTVGRLGYGSVFWPDPIDVSGLNLDEIVHFRHKEVTVYLDDENKPDIGIGLNRKAEITLERIWPHDKTTHEPIKDVRRLEAMKFRNRLEKACIRMEAEFVDYRPDTGSWVFKVEHFTKYGLDEEMDNEDKVSRMQVEEVRTEVSVQPVIQRTQIHKSPPKISRDKSGDTVMFELSKPSTEARELSSIYPSGLGGDDMVMEDIAQEPVPQHFDDTVDLDDEGDLLDGSSMVYSELIGSTKAAVDKLKASFFEGDTEKDGFFMKEEEKQDRKRMTTLQDVYERSASLLGVPGSSDMLNLLEKADVSSLQDVLAGSIPLIKQKNVLRLVPYCDSLLANRSKYILDAACNNNRRFRVGWGPGRCFVRLEAPEASVDFRTGESFPRSALVDKNGFVVILAKLDRSSKFNKEALKEFVDYQMEHSDWSSDFCPHISPRRCDELIDGYMRLSDSSSEEKAVWKLCLALWGPNKYFPEGCQNNPYAMEIFRKRKLSDWISTVSKPAVAEAVKLSRYQGNLQSRRSANAYYRLTNGQISEAALEAMEDGDLRLSLLLTQAGSCPQSQVLCLEQLSQWFQCGADLFIEEFRMKMFTLLAGRAFWELSNGDLVNTCSQLDWKRAFGVQLWYCSGQSASISEVLEKFKLLWEGEQESEWKGLVRAPVPSYEEHLPLTSKEKCTKLDLSYHLLNLFCDRSYRMETVLNPITWTSDHTDCHLSWHLWCVLDTLDFSHMSEEKLSQLHSDYSAQLCQIGLWKYAAFVLMHIRDCERRSAAVKKLLADHAEELLVDEETETFLVNRLRVSEAWIAEAKCLWCRVNGDSAQEAWLAAKAGSFNLSHSLFQSKLAPWSVVDGDLEKLKRFSDLLRPHSQEIQGWPIGGQIYDDFLLLSQTLDSVRKEELALSSLENLKPCLMSLASRLNGMECSEPFQRLAQGEMAKKVCQLLRLVLTKEEQMKIGSVITKLTMPDDYMLEELQRLIQLGIEFVDEEI